MLLVPYGSHLILYHVGCCITMLNKQWLAVRSALMHADRVCACVAWRVGVIIKRYKQSIISRLNNKGDARRLLNI